MISRRDSAYSSMIWRNSAEGANLGGGSSFLGRGLSGRFMPRLSVREQKKPLTAGEGLALKNRHAAPPFSDP